MRVPCRSNHSSADPLRVASRPQMQTSAPAWASASAMPRPIPRLPPVISATLPVKSNAA